VPEAEVRAPPLRCRAGERRGDELVLHTSEGPVTLRRGEALLVVRGPIAREHQALPAVRRIASTRPDEGFRVHVHRRAAARPLEIDPLQFETGFAVSGSTRLEIDAWLAAVTGDARRDDGFARLPPVLAPVAPEPDGGGALAAAGALGGTTRGGSGTPRPLLLDNLAQFRFYSGCLAAIERRRSTR
jgi:hypothetical protein